MQELEFEAASCDCAEGGRRRQLKREKGRMSSEALFKRMSIRWLMHMRARSPYTRFSKLSFGIVRVRIMSWRNDQLEILFAITLSNLLHVVWTLLA